MSGYRIFAQRVGLVGVTNLLVSLSGMVFLPILTKGLPIEDYGLWVQINVTLALVPGIINLGLPNSMVRFLAATTDKGEIKEGFYSIFAIILFMGGIFALILYLLAKPVAEILFDGRSDIIKLLSPLLFLECLYGLLVNYLRTFQKIKMYSVFVSLRTILNMLLVSCFVLAGYGLEGAVLGLLASSTSVSAALIVQVVREIGIHLPNFTHTREHLAFGLPTVPSTLSSWMVESSDRYIIGILLGSAFVGYYSPGYVLGNLIFALMSPLFFMLPMVLYQQYDQSSYEGVTSIIKDSLRCLLGLAIPAAAGVSLLSWPILDLLTTPEIASRGYLITPFVAISAIFFGCYAIAGQVLVLEKRTGVIGAIWTVAAAANVGLNLLLIPSMGIIGAAFSTTMAYIGAFALTAHYSNRYIKLEVEATFLAKCLASSALMGLLILLLKPEGAFALASAVIIGAGTYLAAMLLLKGICKNDLASLIGILRP
ncbi:MAG: polysaccharide biosynthesis C-terminal domain-containing protein [Methanotrichaceae archaeon]|nr:polysaccharide biosynthesis C-terminal domain-containing protein [Methanotrichaceae archaeon]